MFSHILYGLSFTLLFMSLSKDIKKTKKALKKTLNVFLKLLPQLTAIFIFVGIILSIVDENTISLILGKESGFIGTTIAAVLGSLTLIPGFVAFPLASNLLKSGAGYIQMAAFISSLMMVGIVTLPLEIKYFGKKVAILRNILAFIFAFFVAYVIGGVFG